MESGHQVEPQSANGAHVNISVPHHSPIQSLCTIRFPRHDLHEEDVTVCLHPFVCFNNIAHVGQFAFNEGLAAENRSMCHEESESVPQGSNMISWLETIFREQEILNLIDVLHVHVWRQRVVYLLIKSQRCDSFLSSCNHIHQLLYSFGSNVMNEKIVGVTSSLMFQ